MDSTTPHPTAQRRAIIRLCTEHDLLFVLATHLQWEFGVDTLSEVPDEKLPFIWRHVKAMVHLEAESAPANVINFPRKTQ